MSQQIRITADMLQSEISKLFDEYSSEVDTAIDTVMEKAGKTGRQLVRTKAKAYGWKTKYVNGWQYKVKKDRLGTSVVIFNGSKPGLPHLLETSHVVRYPYGNRAARQTASTAKPHVHPAEDEIIDEVIRDLRRELQ